MGTRRYHRKLISEEASMVDDDFGLAHERDRVGGANRGIAAI